MRLPEEYVKKMKWLLGDEYSSYEASLSEPLNHCLRVNTLKISVEDFLRISPFSLTPVPWTDNTFYYDAKECQPSKHPFYFAGLYYLQEASAALPAATIPIEPGDRVLDICAAPGGKTTELAARLRGTGVLVSNDISASRLKALQKNVEIYGARNVVITCETPERLAQYFPGYFDKILIDAPCSGEGMFRKSTSMVTAWEQNGNLKFVEIQRSILKEAVKLLRPGGVILYSTCTFDPREDEEQLLFLLSLDKTLRILPIRQYEGFECGHMDWVSDEFLKEYDINTDDSDMGLSGTMHLFPHRVTGEGHFVSLIKSAALQDADAEENDNSREEKVQDIKPKKQKSEKKLSDIPSDLSDFLSHIDLEKSCINLSQIEINGGKAFLMCENAPATRGLRTMRTGVYLGELKKNRFEPSQSLAMILESEHFDNVLSLSPDSTAVNMYLRGQTIDLDEIDGDTDVDSLKNGWVLVSVLGFPLGFAKNTNGTLKNKYLPGWRLM